MNSENRKTCNRQTLILNLSDKISLKSRDKYVALPILSIYYSCENIKESCQINKFKISSLP